MALEHGKTQELPRNDEVLTTVLGYISAISCSSFIRCFMLLFPLEASSQSSKQRWGERSRIQFPHYSAVSNFFVDNYAKIGANRGLDQWEGSLPVLMEASKQAKGGRICSGWLIIILAQQSQRLNIGFQNHHIISQQKSLTSSL